jgi:hypothetical protein
MRYSLLLLAALGLGAAACTRPATPSSAASVPPIEATPGFHKPRPVSTIPIHTFPSDTALVFQRTPCYGTCPAYTATIFRNGEVRYHGERSVPVMGEKLLRLPQTTVQTMLDKARALNFNSLPHEYRAQVSDLPATIVTSYLPGQKPYQVLAPRGTAPTQLQEYFDYLQAQLDPLAGLPVGR